MNIVSFAHLGNGSARKDPLVAIIFHTITLLSLIGQLFTIFTYRSIRNKRTKFYGYVAAHSVLGLPCTLVNYPIMLYFENDDYCKNLGFIYAFTYLAYMLWSTLIAWVIYISLKNETHLKSLKWRYIFWTYLVSALLILYPKLSDRFGRYEGEGVTYCWYDMSKEADLPIILGYYVPLGVSTILSFYFYISSYLIVRKAATEEESQEFYRFIIFPLMQVVCNSGLILQWISNASGTGYTQAYEIVHVCLSKGQGFYEALAYALNRNVRAEIKKVWCTKRNKPSKSKLLFPPVIFDEETISCEINERSRRSEYLSNNGSY